MDTHPASSSPDVLLAQMDWVRELARRLLQDPSHADDVAQEVWIAASERPPAAASDIRSWLSVVTRRVVQGLGRSESRRRRREAQAARSDVVSDHDDVLERGEMCQRLVAAVMQLDEPCRSTVLHRYLDGLTTKQIASRNAVTEAVVRKRLSRSMQQLRARLDEDFEGGRTAWLAALVHLNPPDAGLATPWVALGGLFVMKKAVTVAVLALVLIALWLVVPGGRWMGRATQEAQALDAGVAALPPAAPLDLKAPDPSVESRKSVVPASGSRTLQVDGLVLNLPYPETTAAELPAVDIEVKLQLRAWSLTPGSLPTHIETTTQTGTDGRFHLEVADPGVAQIQATLFVNGDARYRSTSKQVKFSDDGHADEARLQRAAHGTLNGIVVDGDDKPLPGVQVQCNTTKGFLSEPKDEFVEVMTDDKGEFAFQSVHASDSFYPGSPEVVALKEGLRMLPFGPAVSSSAGGWKRMRIQMVPSGGKVTVRVRDEHGQPRAKTRIELAVSRAEPGAGWEAWSGESDPIKATTNDEGIAELDNVWIEKRLRLRVGTDLSSWTREQAADGLVDLRSAPHGSALVVPASKTLGLEVVVPENRLLRLIVMSPAGERAANVDLRLRAQRASDLRLPLNAKTDAHGLFEQELPRLTEAFVIQAKATAGGDGPNAAGPRWVGSAKIEVAPGGPASIEERIELQEALSITGTVHEADGNPCKGQVVAIPVSAPSGEYTRGVGVPIGADGRFEARDLVAGLYDLDVRPSRNYVFTDCLLTQRFEAIEAGSRDVRLVLGEDEAVNVEIEVHAAEGTIAKMTVVTGMFHPHERRDPDGHTPDTTKSFSGIRGWPTGATLNFGGQTGAIDSEGVTGFLHLAGTVPVHRLKPMNAGWYVLGIDASDASGERYHPCGTGLVYLTPGSYHFRFDMVRQTTIEGTVVGGEPHTDLRVGLFESNGDPVQFSLTNRHLGDLGTIAEGGRFVMEGVPVGEFHLRVGPEALLRNRGALFDQVITIRTSKSTPVLIQLP